MAFCLVSAPATFAGVNAFHCALMELITLAFVRTTTSQVLPVLPDFITPDGSLIPYAEGEAALRQGQALLIGNLLVGIHSLSVAA